MTLLPAGNFMMGSADSAEGHASNESPLHKVIFAHAFAMSVHDVTRSEYAAFARATSRATPPGCYFQGKLDPARAWNNPGYPQTDRDPVVCVSWEDATAYIAWLNTLNPRGSKHPGAYALPSEARWEYAARAGTHTRFVWGDEMTHDRANLGKEEAPLGPFTGGPDKWEYTAPVGSFPPNAWGLTDMAGNVAQIMDDCRHDFQSNYDGAPADGSVWRQDDCRAHTVRGSAWDAPLKYAGVAGRGAVFPDMRLAHVGFKVVKTGDGGK